MTVNRRNLLGPLLLMAFGVLLLLNTLDIIPWRFWADAWRFWPAFLILAGLALLLRREAGGNNQWLGWLVVALAVFCLMTGIFANPAILPRRGEHQAFSSDFTLATEAAQENASSVTLRINQRRGELKLGVKSGGPLLNATGNYNDPQDEPNLRAFGTQNANVSFDAGRRGGFSMHAPFAAMPRYELSLGRPELPHDFDFNLNAGTAELDLAELGLTSFALNVNSGVFRAQFGANPRACARFTATLNSGELHLAGLGGLGARDYNLHVNSGHAEMDLAGLEAGGGQLTLFIKLNSGNVSLSMPSGICLEVTVNINAGEVVIGGQRYHRGKSVFIMGEGTPQGTLQIEVNSGLVDVS